MSTIEKTFVQLLDESVVMTQKFDKFKKWFDARYCALLEKKHKLLFPKATKHDLEKINKDMPEFVDSTREKYMKVATKASSNSWKKLDEHNKLLQGAAEKEGIQPVAGMKTQICEVSSSGYLSQGFGAERYASAEAEAKADDLRSWGLEVTIEKEIIPIRNSRYHEYLANFRIYANVDEIGKQKLMYARGKVAFRTWMKNAMKRGANLRVLCPGLPIGLPIGLEAKMGLDLFGNELKKESVA